MRFRRKAKKIGDGSNQKVKNATPTTLDGIAFKSKLEAHVYSVFKEAGIVLNYEAMKFDIIPAFEYKGVKFRKATITPDFTTPDGRIIIEAKGFPNEVFPLRWKIFNHTLSLQKNQPHVYLVHNKQETLDALTHVLLILNDENLNKRT